MFKKGDNVICINNNYADGLTLDTNYTVLEDTNDRTTVKNDRGKTHRFYTDRFKLNKKYYFDKELKMILKDLVCNND